MAPTTMTPARPFREMIRPNVDRPLSTHFTPERRQHTRYSRCALGTLVAEEESVPVACVDVSIGGAQVVTPAQTKLTVGDRVTVRVEQGDSQFEDQFTVVHRNAITTGTALHLAL